MARLGERALHDMDRETLKTTAERQAARGRLHDAIATYNTLVEQHPSDAATWLRLGDLNAQVANFSGAVAAYDNVARYYKENGFPLKAIAVFRRTREIVLTSVPSELPSYLHVSVATAECCEHLGLPGDAFTAYMEAASDHAAVGSDDGALEMWSHMARLDPDSALPHVKAAEHCVRLKRDDDATEYFKRAVDLLVSAGKSMEAVKLIERVLAYRRDARYARLAAKLHLDQQDRGHTLRAIRYLQLSHEIEPHDLDTMTLLVRAFDALGQDDKAIEVRKEMARVALADKNQARFDSALAELERVAPNDPDVQEIKRSATGKQQQVATDFIDGVFDDTKSPSGEAAAPPSARSAPKPPPPEAMPTPSSSALRRTGRADPASRERLLSDIDDLLEQQRYHAAVHPLREAVQRDPNSLLLREKLRDLFASMNYPEGVRNETNALAAIHAQNGNYRHARALVDRVLHEDPENTTALQLKAQLERVVARARAKRASAK